MAFDTNLIVLTLKKHPLGFSAFGLVVLMLIGIYVRSGSKEDLTLQLEEVTAQGQRLKNNLKYSIDLSDQLAAINAATMEITDRAISPAALATNLQYFYRLESDLGVEYTDLRQGVPPVGAAGATYLFVPYNLSVQGTYSQLLDFIRRLESGILFVRFKTINLTPGRSMGETAQDPTNPVLALGLSIEILGK